MDFLRSVQEGPVEPDAMMARHEMEVLNEIAIRDPFDPSPLVALFEQFHVQIDQMANKSQGLKVVDDVSNQAATLMTTQAKTLANAIEKKRVELKEPYLRVTSVLDSETKGLKDRLGKIQGYINGLIAPFLQAKEQERREAERKAQEDAARYQRELDEKARIERERVADEARKIAELEGKSKAEAEALAKHAASLVEDAPVVVAEAPKEIKVETEAGSAKLKEEIDFEIINPLLLPEAAFIARKEQVLAALKPWIAAQIKSGIRDIPGVRIFKVAKVQTRATKRNYEKF